MIYLGAGKKKTQAEKAEARRKAEEKRSIDIKISEQERKKQLIIDKEPIIKEKIPRILDLFDIKKELTLDEQEKIKIQIDTILGDDEQDFLEYLEMIQISILYLIIAAKSENNHFLLSYFIEKGCDVNQITTKSDGWSWSVKSSPDKEGNIQQTPLVAAIFKNDIKSVKILVENNASKKIGATYTPLIAAICMQNLEIVKYLLENVDDPEFINQRPTSGIGMPLQVALSLIFTTLSMHVIDFNLNPDDNKYKENIETLVTYNKIVKTLIYEGADLVVYDIEPHPIQTLGSFANIGFSIYGDNLPDFFSLPVIHPCDILIFTICKALPGVLLDDKINSLIDVLKGKGNPVFNDFIQQMIRNLLRMIDREEEPADFTHMYREDDISIFLLKILRIYDKKTSTFSDRERLIKSQMKDEQGPHIFIKYNKGFANDLVIGFEKVKKSSTKKEIKLRLNDIKNYLEVLKEIIRNKSADEDQGIQEIVSSAVYVSSFIKEFDEESENEDSEEDLGVEESKEDSGVEESTESDFPEEKDDSSSIVGAGNKKKQRKEEQKVKKELEEERLKQEKLKHIKNQMKKTMSDSYNQIIIIIGDKNKEQQVIKDELNEVLKSNPKIVSYTNKVYGISPISLAIKSDKNYLISFLKNKGFDIDVCGGINSIHDEISKTALGVAVSTENIEAVKILVENGADPDKISETNISGLTPLIEAILANNLEIVKILLDGDASINMQLEKGYRDYPIQVAISCLQHVILRKSFYSKSIDEIRRANAIVRLLIKEGATVYKEYPEDLDLEKYLSIETQDYKSIGRDAGKYNIIDLLLFTIYVSLIGDTKKKSICRGIATGVRDNMFKEKDTYEEKITALKKVLKYHGGITIDDPELLFCGTHGDKEGFVKNYYETIIKMIQNLLLLIDKGAFAKHMKKDDTLAKFMLEILKPFDRDPTKDIPKEKWAPIYREGRRKRRPRSRYDRIKEEIEEDGIVLYITDPEDDSEGDSEGDSEETVFREPGGLRRMTNQQLEIFLNMIRNLERLDKIDEDVIIQVREFLDDETGPLGKTNINNKDLSKSERMELVAAAVYLHKLIKNYELKKQKEESENEEEKREESPVYESSDIDSGIITDGDYDEHYDSDADAKGLYHPGLG
tara:strand:+ start:2186 stop:5587 length:3402 start_codon:yes stop_codon:yes gene_type:complete